MKTVLGLKASPSALSDGSGDSSDFFFGSESEDEPNLALQPLPTTTPLNSPIRPCIADFGSDDDDFDFVVDTPDDQITSFDEASRRITPILGNLEEYVIPPPFKGNLYFVPEHAVSDEFSVDVAGFSNCLSCMAMRWAFTV